MLIIAHRAQDVNQGIPCRFGVEIDVRDCSGLVGVTHDPVIEVYSIERATGVERTGRAIPTLLEWMTKDLQSGERPVYAINVKADGIEQGLREALQYYPSIRGRAFFFDGSSPTMRRLKLLNVPVAERISEEEPYRGHSHLIWLDRWDWEEGIEMQSSSSTRERSIYVPMMNSQGRRTEVYAVSPELHRPSCPPGYRQFWWRRFQEMGCAGICTDYWLECEEFFG